MSDEKILVHRLNDSPIEIDRDEIIFTDHSRIADGLCNRRRFMRYEIGGSGFVSPGKSYDLSFGSMVHEGLDLRLQGGTFEKAIHVANKYYSENDPAPNYLLPEQQEALRQDDIHLAKALLYAYERIYIPQVFERFEVLMVEQEINWLIKELDFPVNNKKYLVMMSRPDGAFRELSTGQIWHVSHKTAKEFGDIQIQKLFIDSQRFSESLALKAFFGEEVVGTYYNYFIKGRKYTDDLLGIMRYNNGLIHPWLNVRATGGEIVPELLSFSYDWKELDGHLMKSRRLGSGWQRISIYDHMDFDQYLEWIENKLVPPGRDYLLESVTGLVPAYFEPELVYRWLEGIQASEEDWAHKVNAVGRDSFDPSTLNSLFKLEHSQCFAWNKRCSYFPICWDKKNLESLVEEGDMVRREANHQQEMPDEL